MTVMFLIELEERWEVKKWMKHDEEREVMGGKMKRDRVSWLMA